MLKYAIKVEKDTTGYIGTCRDLPFLTTAGDSVADTLAEAIDALEVTISIYIEDGQRVPMPTQSLDGEYYVYLPCLTAAKVYLQNALIDTRTSKKELAAQLGIHQQAIHRLLDINHSTKIETIEKALAVLGKRLEIDIHEAA